MLSASLNKTSLSLSPSSEEDVPGLHCERPGEDGPDDGAGVGGAQRGAGRHEGQRRHLRPLRLKEARQGSPVWAVNILA